jgi:hypothetical protein
LAITIYENFSDATLLPVGFEVESKTWKVESGCYKVFINPEGIKVKVRK